LSDPTQTAPPQFNPEVLRLLWTKDKKRVVLHITYIGFCDDLKEFIEGKRSTFRMKQIPKRFRTFVPPGTDKFNPTIVRMRKSKDEKRVIMTVSYVGFAQDLKEFLGGQRNSFRLKLMPPYDPSKVKPVEATQP
jgi:hypothetical protein